MNRLLALTVGLGVLAGARIAGAQEAQIGYQGLPHKSSGETATGINVAEGMILHVGAGAEAGYDSNVFYANSDGPNGVQSSGIIRTTGFAELTNSSRTGGAPAGLSFDVRGGLTYRHYTSPDANVARYRDAFQPSAGLSLGYGSGRLAFQLTDSFTRLEDPPYAGSTGEALARDSNLAAAEMRFAPGGGRINTMLRYTNIVDIFESTQFAYASSVTHQLLLDVSWKWLPKTAVFLQANQGYVTYLNAGTRKVSSFPLRIATGLRGLITPKLSVNLSLGYVNSFYSSGASTNGVWGSTFVEAQATLTPTVMSRVVVGYRHDFANSVISSYYYEDAVYASYVQQLGGRLAFDLSGRISRRQYEGLLDPASTSRTDNLVTVGATLDYFIRNWIYGGVGYSLLTNISDYRLPDMMNAMGATVPGTSVEYTKHQVFARLGVTY
jgi:hypothetical protein